MIKTPFKKSFICFLLFLSGMVSLCAQNFQLKQFTFEDGLASLRINTLLQDQRGFIWLGTGNGLQSFDGYSFRTYQHISGYEKSLRDNYILSLYEDRKGTLWVGTDSGLHGFDWKTESFLYIPYASSVGELPDYSVNDIFEDRQGNLWVGTYNGLFRVDQKQRQLIPVLDKSGKNSPGIPCEDGIREEEEGRLWLGTGVGLYRFDPGQSTFTLFKNTLDPSKDYQNNLIQALHQDQQGQLLVGTRNALFLFDQEKASFSAYTSGPLQDSIQAITSIADAPSGLLYVSTFGRGLYEMDQRGGNPSITTRSVPFPVMRIQDLLQDDHGNCWIGTYADGLYQLSPGLPILQFSPKAVIKPSPAGNSTRSFYERPDGKIWLGIDGGGVQLFDPISKSFLPVDQPEDLQKSRIYALTEDNEGNVWAATMGKGIYQFNPTKPEKGYRYFELPRHAEVTYKDRQGDIWLIGREAFCRYKPKTDTIIYYRKEGGNDGPFKNNGVWCVFEDRHGNLWSGTEKGLFLYERARDTFIPLGSNTGNESEQMVWVIAEDQQGRLWTGGKKGLQLFDPIRRRYLKSWGISDGLPDQVVQSIVEDSKGFLWIGTNRGLCRFDPTSETFRNFDQNKTTSTSKYNSRAALKTRNGNLLFGNQNGFEMVDPDQIRDNEHQPPVLITSFKLANKTVPLLSTPDDTLAIASPLENQIAATDKILLRHWQNDFSFEFAALDFIEPQKNRYRYKLEPYHQDWVETGAGQRHAVFTNLSPGKYRFHVIGSNNHGQWNLKGDFVQITIMHPWWATPLAYMLYASVLSALLLVVYRAQLKRRLMAAETQRLRELDAFKTRFYTNITHEFRTPLTVILGMADRLGKQELQEQEQGLSMIKRNGQQLLRLVNQMLDLRKVESGHMALKMVQAEVVDYLQYLCSSFQPLAELKDIDLVFDCELSALVIDIDPEKLGIIVSNLLTNAIKFTPEGGRVSLEATLITADSESLLIQIKDNGIGIPEGQLPLIFDSFYQIDNQHSRAGLGTGIGLTLIKELVKLHGGDIEVESKEGKGSQFSVHLPITQNAPIIASTFALEDWSMQMPTDMPAEIEAKSAIEESIGPLALIIEDNPDVVRYLKICLETEYQIICAYNGRDGIAMAIEKVPDIIISDVMMPEKDGYEVCDTLKNDERTSHIPIVLLTAKSDAMSRIKGLQKGADAYLAKPFNEQELQVRLEKLIELRKKLRERYQELKELSPTADPVFAKEDAFLLKLRNIIEAHLTDSKFGPRSLSKEISLSHSQLFRKIKTLTGKSIARYIRLIRLQRAAYLLRNSDLNISEIAYQVGFNDPAYFTRSFQQEYGMPPSTLRMV